MTNSEKFKEIFGIDAIDFWCLPYDKMCDWVVSDVPERNVGDTISRQAAIDAVDKYIHKFDCIDANFLDGLKTAKKLMMQIPSAQPERKKGESRLVKAVEGMTPETQYEFLDWLMNHYVDAVHRYKSGSDKLA